MSDSLVPLAVAFGIAWLLIGAYVIRLARAQQKITKRLDELPTSRGNGAS
jgi:CcmD family protein